MLKKDYHSDHLSKTKIYLKSNNAQLKLYLILTHGKILHTLFYPPVDLNIYIKL